MTLLLCAWVLWGHESVVLELTPDGGFRGQNSNSAWGIIAALETRPKCEQMATAQYQLLKTGRALSVGDKVQIFTCLPDTVDPRK